MVKRRIVKITFSVVLIALAVVMVLPIIFTVLCSIGIDFNEEITFSLEGYIDFFVWKPLYLKAYLRSVLIAGAAMFGTLLVSIPAAYIFAKVPFRGRNFLFYIYIIVMMMPFQVTLLPQYIVSRYLNIYDTLYAMILPGIFAPFSVFLLTQITKSVPGEFLEAVRLDTSNIFVVLTKIVVPIIRPGIVCAAVLVFTDQWNLVAEPIVLMETIENYPLAVLLSSSATLNLLGFAATVVFMLLPILLFGFFEDEITEGLGEYRLK
ncbi:MAG: binding-protein-dependent transport system inner rane component [Herbinix sp.]|jgi:multiple sugar transport system permease protein|nr:binding-protein-dependent transport system inner rane component [Herbinix sp.]